MQAFIARQPIFDRHEKVFGYELLYRSGWVDRYDHSDANVASLKVIADTLNLIGLEALTNGKPAFFNVTREVLLSQACNLLPASATIVEILESVEPDDEVVAACRDLKDAGYLLALDDFVDNGRYAALLDLIDFVKVDFTATDPEERRALPRRLSTSGLRVVAEKVETPEEHRLALDCGYTHFQGFFFSKPVTLAARDVPALKLQLFRLLQEVLAPELDMDRIEGIIKREMTLCYKLLRFVNSATFSWRTTVQSVRRALQLLGERQTRQWAALFTVANMAEDKPEELVIQAVVRARFCELLAGPAGIRERSQDLFLMGMFSLLDSILGRPLPALLAELPLSADVGTALLGADNRLRRVLDFSVACEKGDWPVMGREARELDLDEQQSARLYVEALTWARETCGEGLLNS